MKKYPDTRARSGAHISMIIVVGNKIYSVNLGDTMAYLTRGSKIHSMNFCHDIVKN